MKKKPLQFDPGRWLGDPDLKLCALATRGFWMSVLCAMHGKDQSGEITGSIEDFRRLGECTEQEAEYAISDLKNTGAADVSDHGDGRITLVNRFMNRAYKTREQAAERQRRHQKKVLDNTEITEAFSRFWRVFPRGVGKGDARKAFVAALNKTSADEIIAGAERYAAWIKANPPDNETFIKTPGPWLRAERWADEATVVPKERSIWDGLSISDGGDEQGERSLAPVEPRRGESGY